MFCCNMTLETFPIALFACVALLTLYVLLQYDFGDLPQRFLSSLLEVAQWARSSGPIGALVLGVGLIAASAAPLPGYGALLLVCGFCFGFPGFLLTFSCGLLGDILGFLLGQYFMRPCATGWIDGSSLMAVDLILSEGKIWPLFLLRVAPYPRILVTYALSLSGIGLDRFVIVSALSLPKQILHVAVGRSCRSLTDVSQELQMASIVWPIVSLVVVVLVSAVLAYVIHAYAGPEKTDVVWLDGDEESTEEQLTLPLISTQQP
eukprot:GGOE01053273.1.p1 GENE.GGOE01053273.1~~GGOE01053273.1.p1  ORF type:complete len:262 (+),score=41.96 GGOE01053273.1:67-852(+)